MTAIAFRAPTDPMLTWSSIESTAIESTLAGKLSPLFSETSAAAVVLAMTRPDPRSGRRNNLSGSPMSYIGAIRCCVRLCEMLASSATRTVAVSMGRPIGWAWKLPADVQLPSSKIKGLSVQASSSISTAFCA